MQAGVALAGLQGFKITPQHAMKVSSLQQSCGCRLCTVMCAGNECLSSFVSSKVAYAKASS